MSAVRKDREEMRGQALRIMQALSGADEELLERCGRKTMQRRRGRQRSRMLSGAWAAALCLAAVGAMSWGGYLLIWGENGGTEGGLAGMPQAIELGAAEDTGGTEQKEGQEGGTETGTERETGAGKLPEEAAGGAEENALSESSGDTAESVSGDGSGQAKEDLYQDAQESKNGAATEEEGCPVLRSLEYTEEEARALPVLSAYIPAQLPQGYTFEGAYVNQDIAGDNLTITWSRGMDSLILSVTTEAEAPATVDTERPEIYDERFYSLPYGETVPEEYRESFDNPVFALEDFTLETVRSRVLVRGEGDTDTPRGNFSVLYPGNVLVQFNGRGTPEEIWEMFGSLGQDSR